MPPTGHGAPEARSCRPRTGPTTASRSASSAATSSCAAPAGWQARMLRVVTGLAAGSARGRGAAAADGARDGPLHRRMVRIYRLGQPWLVLEGVSDRYVAIDFAAEVRRLR